MMIVKNYIAPQIDATHFHCPYCNVLSHQNWYQVSRSSFNPGGGFGFMGNIEGFKCCYCDHCSQVSFWHQNEMIFPTASIAPFPSADMPADTAEDFNEAREVLARSPRSSAALLRLALQKLCKHLGQPGKNINEDIGALVSTGLSPKIQMSLDIIRVIGNNAVHPGTIDLRDDQATALALFDLLNLIVEEMITRPREIDEIYKRLPTGALDGIARRDLKP